MTARHSDRREFFSRSQVFVATVAAASLAGCGGFEDPDRFGNPGEFVSGDPNVATSGGGGVDAGTGAPPSPPASGGDDAERAIAEADIVQMRGDTLYALSRHAGLAVVDLATPSEPELISRHRSDGRGTPFEMYLRGDFVLAMYRAWGRWTPAGYEQTRSSRIEVIDVSDPTDPEVVESRDVPGSLSDSRIVGDVLYVASLQDGYCGGCDAGPSTAISALSVADPEDMAVIDELVLSPEDPNAYGWSRSVTTTAERMYVGGADWSRGEPHGSRIDVIDISDPEGELVRGDSVPVAGQITSRWQMDEHEGVLRVVSQPADWGITEPRIETFAVESSQSLVALGSAPIELPRPETLQSVRFDGDRGYAITFERTDPLFTIDLSDPAAPEVVGELEIPGWVYHMEPRGDRLVGLGFEPGNEEGALHVSLFDVSDFAEPTMIERVHFGGDWGRMAEDQDRIHKALRVLDDRGLILVPYAGWRHDSGCGSYESGIQMIDFEGDELTRRGVARTDGTARRALFHRDRLVTMTDETVQVFDAGDRDAPTQLGRVPLASLTEKAATVGDVIVRLGYHRASGLGHLDVVPASDPETQAPIGWLDLSDEFGESSCDHRVSARLFPAPPHVWVVGPAPGGPAVRVAVVDLSDSAAPTLVNTIDLDVKDVGRSGYGRLVDAGERIVQIGDSLALLDVRHREGEASARIDILDLSDPTTPSTRSVPLPDALGYTGLVAGDGEVALSHWTPVGEGLVKFFLDRIEVEGATSPANEVANIPGSLLALGGGDEGARRALTVDYRRSVRSTGDAAECSQTGGSYDWDAERCVLVHRTLKLLDLDSGGLKVIDTHELDTDAHLDRPVLGDDRVFAYARWNGRWGHVLVISGLRGGAIDIARVNAGGWARVLAADGTRALVSGDTALSLRSLDASDIANLSLESHGTLRSYTSDVRLEGDRALCSLGFGGLQVLDLTEPR